MRAAQPIPAVQKPPMEGMHRGSWLLIIVLTAGLWSLGVHVFGWVRGMLG